MSEEKTEGEVVDLQRKSRFFAIRWVVLLWLAVDFFIRWQEGQAILWVAAVLAVVYLGSQIVTALLPSRFFEGLKFCYIMFLFDLSFILLSLWVMNQVQSFLLAAIFLSIFIAAVAQKFWYTCLTSVVVAGVYLACKIYTPQGFDYVKPQDLLELPFILILSLHSSILVQETQVEIVRRKTLEASKGALTNKLKKTSEDMQAMSQFFESVLGAIPVALVMMDSNFRVRYFNKDAEAVFGTKRRDILDREIKDVEVLEPLLPALRDGLDLPVEPFDLNIKSDKAVFSWLRVRVFPVKNQFGNILGSLGVIFVMSEDGPEMPVPLTHEVLPPRVTHQANAVISAIKDQLEKKKNLPNN